jgi:hypothetical protein
MVVDCKMLVLSSPAIQSAPYIAKWYAELAKFSCSYPNILKLKTFSCTIQIVHTLSRLLVASCIYQVTRNRRMVKFRGSKVATSAEVTCYSRV